MHEEIEKLVIDSLQAAYQVHEALGVDGEQSVKKNQFGDTALRVDIECEKAVIETIRASKIPIRLISEEHGIQDFGSEPRYLAILDGIDGTALYKKARNKSGYGTMFAVFDGLTPKYRDYLGCGVMQHATKGLYIAVKNEGACVYQTGIRQPISTQTSEVLSKDTIIYVDEYFEYNRKMFTSRLEGFNTHYTESSAQSFVELADGRAGLVLECTRKGNLEFAVSYGLITEAGGVVTNLDGHDIGNQAYLSYGQSEQIGIIAAANYKLVKDLLLKLGDA